MIARGLTVVVGGVALLLSACGVSGGGTVVLQGYDGLMDCPSEQFEHSVGEIDVTAAGSATPEEALLLLTPDLGLPPGSPEVEAEAADSVTYLFKDPNGLRLGRVVITHTPNGWFAATTERCG